MDKKSIKLELFANTKVVYLPGHLLLHHNTTQIMQSKELLT